MPDRDFQQSAFIADIARNQGWTYRALLMATIRVATAQQAVANILPTAIKEFLTCNTWLSATDRTERDDPHA